MAAPLLTTAGQAHVAELLGPTTTRADVATWADDIRRERPQTAAFRKNLSPHAAIPSKRYS